MEVRGGRGERRGKGEGKLIFSLEFYLIFFSKSTFFPLRVSSCLSTFPGVRSCF